MPKPELSLVIPCYNEEKSIKAVASDLARTFGEKGIYYEMILVDNGSSDETGRVIRELAEKNSRIKTVVVKRNRGYGFGVMAGLNRTNGKFIGWTCADGQVSPEDTVRIFRLMRAKDLDVCKARRITRGDGITRKIASLGYNTLLRLMFSVRIPDVNGYPKIMKAESYRELGIKSKDWFIDTEILIKSTKKGYKIGCVPVIFKARAEGKSKVGFRTVLDFSKDLLRYKFFGV